MYTELLVVFRDHFISALMVIYCWLAIMSSCHLVVSRYETRLAVFWFTVLWLIPIVGLVLYWTFVVDGTHQSGMSMVSTKHLPERQRLPLSDKASIRVWRVERRC